MSTRNDQDKQEGAGNGNAEKRAQTIMLGVIMLLISWQFKTTIEFGNDLAGIKVQMNDLKDLKSSMQPTVNQLGLDNNKLRLDMDNTIRRVEYLEALKR